MVLLESVAADPESGLSVRANELSGQRKEHGVTWRGWAGVRGLGEKGQNT